MKKFVFALLSVFAFAGFASAQSNDCMVLFPNEKGSSLVTKSYDGQGKLAYTTTYQVQESAEHLGGPDTYMSFSVINGEGVTVDQGNLDAYCNDGNFYFKSVSHATCPEIAKMLSSNTQLLGSYLDYPDLFTSSNDDGPFSMEGAEFTVKDKADKKEFLKVRVYNREYEKNEKIHTPAGDFDAAKIKFNVEVYDNDTKTTTTYQNTEWYALGAGIVRTETFDKNNNLMGYTQLETLNQK